MNIFKKGAFSYDPNMTPQQLADKRAMLALLQPKYGKASYIGEGLGQLATGVATGIRTRKLDEIEGKGREQGANLFSGLFGGTTQSTSGQSGPMNIIGVDPGYGDPNDPVNIAGDTMTALGKDQGTAGYRASLIGTESGGNWGAQNNEMGAGGKRGHYGRVQFGQARLQEAMDAGAIPQGTTPEQFMASPALQIAAENWHFGDLEKQLAPYVGAVVNGQTMDLGALVAMGHLGGAAGAKRFVESGGKYNPSDAYGTSLLDYARTHGGQLGGPVAAPAGASTATNSAMPSIDPQALAAALANPWLSPEERSVLTTIYDQQVQAGDPLRQIEVAKGMAELEAMGQPPDPKYDFMQMDDGTLVRTDSAGNISVVGKYAPDAGPEAPQTQTFFDEETGQEYRGQWNPQTGQWERVGGVKALGGDASERYRAVGGQVWDFKPEGGGPPVLIGGTEEIIYGPDGNPIVVRGASGTAGKMKLTEGQSKDNVFVTRADGALKAFEEGNSGALLSFGESAAGSLPFGVGRYMQGNDYQTAENQGNEFLQAILRKDTGAAITVDEQRLYGDTYLPRPGDGPAVLEAKKLARARAVEAMKSGMDPRQVAMTEQANIAAIARAGANPSAGGTTVNGPAAGGGLQPGAIEDGFRFKGGDPSDPANWEQVQ